jgi:hypothetical protein
VPQSRLRSSSLCAIDSRGHGSSLRGALKAGNSRGRAHYWRHSFKAGKTTLKGNVIRSLVDGTPFLDRYAVAPIARNVVDCDFEMSESQINDWYGAYGIQNTDRVIVAAMRGRAAAFNPLHPDGRAELVKTLQRLDCAYLVIDCARPIMDALGLDEHRDAGRLLVAVDALISEAGIREALVIHHMGHTGERARGDSRLATGPTSNGVWSARTMNQHRPASGRFNS